MASLKTKLWSLKMKKPAVVEEDSSWHSYDMIEKSESMRIEIRSKKARKLIEETLRVTGKGAHCLGFDPWGRVSRHPEGCTVQGFSADLNQRYQGWCGNATTWPPRRHNDTDTEPTKIYDAKVSVRSRFKILANMRTMFDEVQLRMFRSHICGLWLDLEYVDHDPCLVHVKDRVVLVYSLDSIVATNENLPPNVIKHLARELKNLDETPPGGIKIGINDDDFSTIYADIEGPEIGLHHVLIVVRCLLIESFPESALNEQAGKMLLDDYEEYAKHARETNTYAAGTTRKYTPGASGSNTGKQQLSICYNAKGRVICPSSVLCPRKKGMKRGSSENCSLLV
ncbi:ubiquitin-conjugating enzyme E2 22-like protein [Tanacetum coccineum]